MVEGVQPGRLDAQRPSLAGRSSNGRGHAHAYGLAAGRAELADASPRMIYYSVAVERQGLKGTFYIDAGGIQMAYDRRLVSLHKFVRDHTKFPAVIDTQKELFVPNSCPEAALYVGGTVPRDTSPAASGICAGRWAGTSPASRPRTCTTPAAPSGQWA